MYINSLNSFEDMLCLSLIGRKKKSKLITTLSFARKTMFGAQWTPATDMSWFHKEQVDSGGGVTVEHGRSRVFFEIPSSLQSLRQDFL